MNTLWSLGVPIHHKIYVFGDNKYFIDSSIHLHAKLHKRHTRLSFCQVQEAIASNMVIFYHVYVGDNPDYIL